MTNELLFFTQILALIAFTYGALRYGSLGLTVLIALETVFANLFVVKQMVLFGLDVTCSDAFAVGSLLALNLLREFYGADAAARAIRISFVGMLFFVAMSQIHLLYLPSAADGTQSGFLSIFSSTPRIVFASIAVYYFVQLLDVRFFGWMKERMEGRRFPIRLAIALFVSQLIDTLLFSVLGLYGIVASLFDIIVVSLVVKWVAIGCSAPLAVFAKRFARPA